MASSVLRTRLAAGEECENELPEPWCAGSSGARGCTPKETKSQMNQKQAKELVRSRLSDKRYEHTLNVKKMAVRLVALRCR